MRGQARAIPSAEALGDMCPVSRELAQTPPPDHLNNTPPLHHHIVSFQTPVEIPGVANIDFLRMATNARRKALGQPELDPLEFYAFVMPRVRSWCAWVADCVRPHRRPRSSPLSSTPNRNTAVDAQHGSCLFESERERGLFRRGEEAERDPAAGLPGGRLRHPGRDRLGAGHRRPARRRQRRQRAEERATGLGHHHGHALQGGKGGGLVRVWGMPDQHCVRGF